MTKKEIMDENKRVKKVLKIQNKIKKMEIKNEKERTKRKFKVDINNLINNLMEKLDYEKYEECLFLTNAFDLFLNMCVEKEYLTENDVNKLFGKFTFYEIKNYENYIIEKILIYKNEIKQIIDDNQQRM